MYAGTPVDSEYKLRQSQKLEALGQLASGIAHELGAPLQALGDNVQFLREAVHALEPLLTPVAPCACRSADPLRADLAGLAAEIPDTVDQMLEAIARASDIVRAMAVLAHPGGDELLATNLNRLVSSAVVLSRSRTRGVATVEPVLDDLPPVLCHPGLISQVVINLLTNAADAVGETVRATGITGRIQVRTEVVGRWVQLSVADTGAGIPEEIQPRIFEPFFTTKQVGAGSGQGLAIVRAIVVGRHSGQVEFTSQPGLGTTFMVRLPLNGPGPGQED
jgi:signal transduction histidine kinase